MKTSPCKMHEHCGKGSGILVRKTKAISLLVKKGDVFLDVGCGPGEYLEYARAAGAEVVGMDIHKPSVDNIKRKGFRAIHGDASSRIPLKSSSVDSALLANVLHGFVENDELGALREIRRVLKNGGRLGVIEFKKNSIFGPPKEMRLSPDEVEKIAVQAGFSKQARASVGPFHHMTIFTKRPI